MGKGITRSALDRVVVNRIVCFITICSPAHFKMGFKKLYFRASLGFPGGTVVENLPANAGGTGSSPGLGRSHMPRSN